MRSILQMLMKYRKNSASQGAATAFDLFGAGAHTDGIFYDFSDQGQIAEDLHQASQDFTYSRSKLETEVSDSSKMKKAICGSER